MSTDVDRRMPLARLLRTRGMHVGDRLHDLESMMTDQRFEFGDRVRHTKRPEWGIGSVVKTESVTLNGQPAQRVSVRFPGQGLKALNTRFAELERVEEASQPLNGENVSAVRDWDRLAQSDWLAPIARRKIEEAMISLPADVRDPFNSLRRRLSLTLDLYRFDRTGRGLIDWAVAQTGMQDPLTRFSRHELERFFDRWAFERDMQLGRLLQEADSESINVDELLAKAPPSARSAVRRFTDVH
jgi:hypothetical protein